MGEIARPKHGKPAHERTLEEFVGTKPKVERSYGFWNEEAFILHRIPYLGDYKIKRRNFFCDEPRKYGTSEPGVIRTLYHCYHLALLKEDPDYALLLVDTVEVGTGEILIQNDVVGEYYRDDFGLNILGIMAAYRGRGAGAHFVAAAIEQTGNVDPSGAYSPAGLATRKRAHRILIENAIKRGDTVPMEVLEEYRTGRRAGLAGRGKHVYNPGMRLLILQTPEERAMGLQHQPFVPDQTILVFPEIYEGDVFHSRNVPEPFDIAFIGEDRKVIELRRMYPPDDTVAAPEGTVKAIETKAGRCGIWGILPGTTFDIA